MLAHVIDAIGLYITSYQAGFHLLDIQAMRLYYAGYLSKRFNS